MIYETTFEGIYPVLQKLWEGKQLINHFDNMGGHIWFKGDEYDLIRPTYLLYVLNDKPIGTTHAYNTGNGYVRIRGTYVEPEHRRSKIASEMLNYAISKYPECDIAYTFPRVNTEKFYQSLGFELKSAMRGIYKGIYYAEKIIHDGQSMPSGN